MTLLHSQLMKQCAFLALDRRTAGSRGLFQDDLLQKRRPHSERTASACSAHALTKWFESVDSYTPHRYITIFSIPWRSLQERSVMLPDAPRLVPRCDPPSPVISRLRFARLVMRKATSLQTHARNQRQLSPVRLA